MLLANHEVPLAIFELLHKMYVLFLTFYFLETFKISVCWRCMRKAMHSQRFLTTNKAHVVMQQQQQQ